MTPAIKAITLNGRTWRPGQRVRCHLGPATISRLYPPHANERHAKAMLDRGEGAPSPTLRFLIVRLDDLEAAS